MSDEKMKAQICWGLEATKELDYNSLVCVYGCVYNFIYLPGLLGGRKVSHIEVQEFWLMPDLS